MAQSVSHYQINYITVDAKCFDVTDVYGASLLAEKLLGEYADPRDVYSFSLSRYVTDNLLKRVLRRINYAV